MLRKMICGFVAAAGMVAFACSGDTPTAPGPGQGMMAVKLTDAPLPFDSIASVNVFIVRIDARRARVDSMRDSAAADSDIDHDHDDHEWEEHDRDSTMWVTIAEPNKAFNLLDLQNGVTAFLGATAIDSGSFKAIRIVIDPMQSTIVLKDGTVLSPTSNPPVEFENRGRHGLLAELDDSAEVHEGGTTTITLDIRLGSSVTLRGQTVHDGFFFRPVVVGHIDHDH